MERRKPQARQMQPISRKWQGLSKIVNEPGPFLFGFAAIDWLSQSTRLCGAEGWEAGQRPEPRAPGNLSSKAFLFFSALPLWFFFFSFKFKNILFKMKFPVKLYIAFYLKMWYL